MYTECLYEFITNETLRDEMKMSINKIKILLLVYYKYIQYEKTGGDKIEQYINLKRKMDEKDKITIENDFEAGYFIGQCYYYLLQESTVDNKLNLFAKYLINVHDMEGLKQRLVDVLQKYSYNEYIDKNPKFAHIVHQILPYSFSNRYEDNKIALFTGYFDDNYFYHKNKEVGGIKNEL